jgi:hypothetical protein
MTDDAKPEQTAVNDSGTAAISDTQLTRACSPDVLEAARRDLIVKPGKVGANSFEGRLMSNLIQQIYHYQRETDPVARAHLENFMEWSVKAIQRTA